MASISIELEVTDKVVFEKLENHTRLDEVLNPEVYAKNLGRLAEILEATALGYRAQAEFFGREEKAPVGVLGDLTKGGKG